MTRLAIFFGLIFLAGATSCSRGSFRVGEGTYCSTDDKDDPAYICDVALGELVCAQTYFVNENPTWVCRRACAAATDCRQTGDVCCEGPIHGRDYGKTRVCVPMGSCQTDSNPLRPTAMAPPVSGKMDAMTSVSPADEDAGDDAGMDAHDAGDDGLASTIDAPMTPVIEDASMPNDDAADPPDGAGDASND